MGRRAQGVLSRAGDARAYPWNIFRLSNLETESGDEPCITCITEFGVALTTSAPAQALRAALALHVFSIPPGLPARCIAAFPASFTFHKLLVSPERRVGEIRTVG